MNRPKDVSRRLRGIFPPLATPMDSAWRIDYRRFHQNLLRLEPLGLSGYVVAGSSGEAPYLTELERLRLTALVRSLARPSQLVITGTGLESTRETIRLSRKVIEAGAHAVLVAPPNYYKARMNSSALQAHFVALADALEAPIILYSIPQFTGLKMEVEAIRTLSKHPNIIGLKESSGDLSFVRAILAAMEPDFRVLIGSPPLLLEALALGAAGGVLSPANFVPQLCLQIYRAFRRGQRARARRLQKKLSELARNITLPYGVAGIKAAMDHQGYFGGQPRLPLLPLTASERENIAANLNLLLGAHI